MYAAFRLVQNRAPGLVTRAANGQPIHMVLSRQWVGHGAAMETGPNYILCYGSELFTDPEDIWHVLCHELVHMADTDGSLSDSREWNILVTPYLQRFRRKYDPSRRAAAYGNDPCAERLGLPSSYAATNTSEALAECAMAMVIGKWSPPPDIQAFISENILSMPITVDKKRDLLRQASARSQTPTFRESISLYTQVLKSDPHCVPAWLGLAHVWSWCEEYELTVYCAEEALQLLLRNGAAYSRDEIESCFYYRGLAYVRQGKFQEALADFNRGIGINQIDPRIYECRANLYASLGQHRKAINDLNKAIALDPDADRYNDRGWERAVLRQYLKAIDDCNQALLLDPKSAAFFDTRGYAFGQMGQYRKAIADCSEAIRIEPKCAAAYFHRARFYRKTGKKFLARRDSEMVKKIGYTPDPGE
jgi:tetratricopeptide (TPR) repeat protein